MQTGRHSGPSERWEHNCHTQLTKTTANLMWTIKIFQLIYLLYCHIVIIVLRASLFFSTRALFIFINRIVMRVPHSTYISVAFLFIFCFPHWNKTKILLSGFFYINNDRSAHSVNIIKCRICTPSAWQNTTLIMHFRYIHTFSVEEAAAAKQFNEYMTIVNAIIRYVKMELFKALLGSELSVCDTVTMII